MRIATWNVNSLKARLEKVIWWIERARPDVLLLQETKLKDEAAPHEAFAKLGYTLCHHGSGGRNGVAIASTTPIEHVELNFGDVRQDAAAGDDDPFGEPRMLAATCNGVRVVSLYAPNGRSVASAFYLAKLRWLERLAAWVGVQAEKGSLVLGGDFNVAPNDLDVWNPTACHGGTHVSPQERDALARLTAMGLVDAYRKHHPEGERYSWWDYRAGDFYKNVGMRIDLLLVGAGIAARTVDAEIDREARKGKPIPSDHAPVFVDLDAPGRFVDAGWTAAEVRIRGRQTGNQRSKA